MTKDPEIIDFLKNDGVKLRKLRTNSKLSQVQLAKLSGMHQRQISQMENGTKDYTVVSLYKYLKGLRK